MRCAWLAVVRGAHAHYSSARAASLALLCTLLAPALLCAQDAAADGGAADRATSFQAVSGAVKESVPGGPLLLAAYGVVWLAVLAYVWRLSRLHAGVDDRLNELERALASAPESTQKHG